MNTHDPRTPDEAPEHEEPHKSSDDTEVDDFAPESEPGYLPDAGHPQP